MKRTAVTAAFLCLWSTSVFAEAAPPPADGTVEQAVADLKNPDAAARFRAASVLKDAAAPETALPLADAVGDMDKDVQLEAIAAELNLFLAEKNPSRRHVALVVERRGRISAQASFDVGRTVVGARIVPCEVAEALVRSLHDDNGQVAFEALYAFGTLAPEVAGLDRPGLLKNAAPNLASLLGAPSNDTRRAALRVIGRVYAVRAGDEPVDRTLGDTVIGALNDKNSDIRIAAMQALGAMRYQRGAQGLAELFQYYKRGPLAEQALDAIAKIGDPASASRLSEQLTGASDVMRAIAIEGLARIGDPAASRAIEASASADRSEAVQLAGEFASASLAHGTIEPIVEAMSRARLHDQAFRYLLELAPGRARQFVRAAQDPDADVRSDVADLLGLAADPAALPIVEPMAKDRDPQAARAGERAVARLHAVR